MLNYVNTFISVAPDCPARQSVIPSTTREQKTIPQIEYELLAADPGKYTQDELLFAVHIACSGISAKELKVRRVELWDEFFSKPHACLRASMLPKKYGWGLYFDPYGRISLCPVESAEYQNFVSGKQKQIEVLPALRSKRA